MARVSDPYKAPEQKCRVCSCTETRACDPPCAWSAPDLCSNCEGTALLLSAWLDSAYRPNWPAMLKEAKAVSDSPLVSLSRAALRGMR
jgi:hypothetical protein